MMMTMEMEWWDKMVTPMRNVWIKVSTRIGLRKTGLVKLKHDVRTCEYEDVHILWEMLKKNETEHNESKKRPFWKFVDWRKCAAPLLCRSV